MIKSFLAVLLLVMGIAVQAQDIQGKWSGTLNVGAGKLRVVFNINKSATGFASTMDSPDQGVKGIPVTSTIFENSILKISITNAGIEYSGELKGDEITGEFKQAGRTFPLTLKQDSEGPKRNTRPQEPIPPYPYHSEEVVFENKKAGIQLAGTLSLPNKEGSFPAVILISGSGPQNRDEEILGHKPFLVLADYLTKKGIAVLRYDDRGVGASTGDFKTATTFDFADDAAAALAYLQTRKEINQKILGLLGHSEGGIIAPLVASRSKNVDFVIMLAGTALRGDRLLLMQQELIAKAMGVPASEIEKSREVNSSLFAILLNNEKEELAKEKARTYLKDFMSKNASLQKPAGMSEDAYINTQLAQLFKAKMSGTGTEW
ncbi:MAG: alpha/beta fold hydrolase [Flavihumibacter sp.]|nr:alpha/beta fold hydrolase [Flavihumibacter sp.]